MILERERNAGRERETLICCFTYLCIHWLILVCALTGDQTCNLAISGWCSNQLSYLTKATKDCWPVTLLLWYRKPHLTLWCIPGQPGPTDAIYITNASDETFTVFLYTDSTSWNYAPLDILAHQFQNWIWIWSIFV